MLFIASVASMYGVSVRMSVEAGRGRRVIEIGETFYINVEVSNLDAAPAKPSNVPGAKLLYFDLTGQSSSFSSVNGKTTQSHTYTYTMTLRAVKEGNFSFGPISVGGVKSNAVNYNIGKASARQQAVPDNNPGMAAQRTDSDKPKFIGKGDGNLFLKASVTKQSVYEQEALVYTVKLYTTYDAIKFIGATAAPKFEGFVVEESKSISNQLSYENYNGKTYATAVIARYIIFPQMTGKLTVSGNTYTVSVDQREYYHDPFWGNMSYSTPLQLNVKPNDLTINVRSLPLPKPADFCGGVGKFNISSQLKSNVFKTNQAASIVYNVTGTGNLKYIQLPDIAALYPRELEAYTPKTDVKANVGSDNVSGSVSFDYSFMPLEEGVFKIPAVKLVYFNPETGKYETSVSRSYEITVGKGVESGKSQMKRTVRFEPQLKDVNASKLCKTRVPYVSRFVYWLWFIIPFITLVVTVALYRNYIKSHADMAALNSKRANKIAKKRLKKAYAAMRANDKDKFYDELLIALWGYIGDKLKMPTSELMRDNIRQMLESRNIPEDKIKAFVDLLDRCEFEKYSSAGGSQGMHDAYDQATEVINDIQNSFKTDKKKGEDYEK